MTKVTNRMTTTGNVYIRDGGRGGGGGASLSLSGGWEYHGGGSRGGNYVNSDINIRTKTVLRIGARWGGYNNSPTSTIYLVNSVVFGNGG